MQTTVIRVAVAFLGLALSGCPERVYLPKVRELVKHANKGEFSRAYACTTEGFRDRVSLEHFKDVLTSKLDIQRAKTHKLEFRRKTSNRAGVVDGRFDTPRGVVTVSFSLTRPVSGFDYLVADIEANNRSIFVDAKR
jgi:hypothetical protein